MMRLNKRKTSSWTKKWKKLHVANLLFAPLFKTTLSAWSQISSQLRILRKKIYTKMSSCSSNYLSTLDSRLLSTGYLKSCRSFKSNLSLRNVLPMKIWNWNINKSFLHWLNQLIWSFEMILELNTNKIMESKIWL